MERPSDTEKNRRHIALWNNAKNRLDSEYICVWTYIFSQKTLLCQGEALHIKADSWLTFWTKSKRICQAGISQWDSIISVSGKERHPRPPPPHWDSIIGMFLERKCRLFLRLLSISLLFTTRKPAQPWRVSPFFVYDSVKEVTYGFQRAKVTMRRDFIGTELF